MSVVASPPGRPSECLDDGVTLAETNVGIGRDQGRSITQPVPLSLRSPRIIQTEPPPPAAATLHTWAAPTQTDPLRPRKHFRSLIPIGDCSDVCAQVRPWSDFRLRRDGRARERFTAPPADTGHPARRPTEWNDGAAPGRERRRLIDCVGGRPRGHVGGDHRRRRALAERGDAARGLAGVSRRARGGRPHRVSPVQRVRRTLAHLQDHGRRRVVDAGVHGARPEGVLRLFRVLGRHARRGGERRGGRTLSRDHDARRRPLDAGAAQPFA